MEKNFARIKNFNVSVRESGGKVIFLRKLERAALSTRSVYTWRR